MNPDAKIARPSFRSKPMSAKTIAAREAADQAKKKVLGSAPAKTKRTGPPTIDDLLADIDNKLNLIKDTSRTDACRRMTDTISQDSSLTASDKKTLTELVGRLSEGS